MNPKTTTQVDPITKKDVPVFESGPFEILLEVAGTPETAAVNVTYIGCTKVICLFPHTEMLPVPWSPSEMGAHSTSPEINKNTSAPEKGSVEELVAQQVKTGQMSFAMLLFLIAIDCH